MVSQKPWLEQWKSLASLDKTIRDYAEAIGPDIKGSELSFVPSHDRDGCLIHRSDTDEYYAISEWAQKQLYTHFGVRPKWFSYVDSDQHASELNLRLRHTQDHKFRTLRVPSADFYGVRGFVSPVYSDVPDTTVLDALKTAFGDAELAKVLPGAGKTDQCLYAHVINSEALAIPTAHGEVYAGLTVLNSEVGYTSLRVLPVMFWDWNFSVIPIPSGKLYRRIHRGKFTNLAEDFEGVVRDNAKYVGDVTEMMRGLADVSFPSEDEAAKALYKMVVSARGTKGFAQDCEHAYRKAGHAYHTGVAVVQTISDVAKNAISQDEVFNLSSIAGAVAVHLTS